MCRPGSSRRLSAGLNENQCFAIMHVMKLEVGGGGLG